MTYRDGPPPRSPGTEIAPGYRLIAHLSRGRTLDVHDAWSDERAARCVVKALRPDRAGDRAAGRRLAAEGRLLRRLSHPHIVRGYEALTEPEPLAVMETLTGATLAALIDDGPRRLPVADVAHLGLHVASAVRYLHANGWLHMDLKPSNIVAEAGRAKVIDLSIARRPGRGRGGAGTWCYMAPEQATGGDLGPAVDVWGLGAVLYEAAAGRAAFDPPTDDRERLRAGVDPSQITETAERRHPQLDGPPELLRRLRRGLPGDLVALVDACLDPDPARRPAVEAVMGALEPLAGLPPRERRFAAAARRSRRR